jgi:cytosine/adenosine deaminase-related metal-dependent hydrolase
MRTVIEGGWVVAFDGTGHRVYEEGAVAFEGDRIVHAGGPHGGPADVRIDARGALVCPGFINTHIHPNGGGSDYLLLDESRNDWRTANYLSASAPLKGKFTPPAAAETAALRAFTLLHALRNGTTTVIDVGGLRGEWEGWVRQIETLGMRVYTGPSFRDHNIHTDAQGRLYYDEDAETGRKHFAEAKAFLRRYDGAAGGRVRGLVNPAQVETCSEPLLREAAALAAELDLPIHTHAGGNLLEFDRILKTQRKTPIAYLADIGFLTRRTLIGHGVFTTAHPWSHYPFGDDVQRLAASGATLGHCPYKYAKMAMTLHSFARCRAAGVNLALGTDTYPMDMVSEMRWAAVLARVVEGNYQACPPRDVFNAATLAPCRFLGRDDLGRLTPGAKADILIVRLNHLGNGIYHDPIKALVDFACGRDVDTVIVDGKTLFRGGHALHVDEDAVYAQAREAIARAWERIPEWRPGGVGLDQIVPPAFPMERKH